MKKLLVTLFCVAIIIALAVPMSPVALADYPPEVEWEKTFGGADFDRGRSVQQTSDGGYIVAGLTQSFGAGNMDAYLIKTDGNGDMVWNATLGGTAWDDAFCVDQTIDGGYIITGETSSFGASQQVYVVKTDSSGSEVWSKTFGVGGGYSVQQTVDGGYIIAGYTTAGNGDVYLVKTDENGYEEWARTFGGSSPDRGYYIQQTMDGGYIIVGDTSSFGAGNGDVYLVKTDENGYETWARTFGGGNEDGGRCVQQTTDGGYIVAGYTQSFGIGLANFYLIKTDSVGNELWNKTFGGPNAQLGYSVDQTADGGYILTGRTNSFGAGWDDIYVVRTDSSGNEVWSNTFGDTGWDVGYSGQQTADGGYIIAGTTTSFGAGDSDVWLIKVGAEPTPDGGCFIATAAYGTSTAAELDVLRAFRDEVLLESTLGSQLVEWYYQTSPPVADFISEHEGLRTLVRELLVDPVAWVVDATEAIWGN